MATRLLSALGLVFLVTAVVSGPLVPMVDFTSPESPAEDGSADVAVRSVPTEEIRLERAAFGAGRYHFDAPPAVVEVADVEGDPVVQYSIDVPALSVTATTRYVLGPDDDVVRLRHPPIGVSPSAVDADDYEATVAIWVRSGDAFARVFEERITVEVAE